MIKSPETIQFHLHNLEVLLLFLIVILPWGIGVLQILDSIMGFISDKIRKYLKRKYSQKNKDD